MRRSHVIVLSSNFETFGLVLAEAMACGKPVISTRSGGPEDFVTEETGILVSAHDSSALAEALIQMRQRYDRYDPALIRAHCVERFSERQFVRKLEDIYRQVIVKAGE
jgi:glycosyltransferase involved in cell wall biosynthesis